eukprot:gnl/MRDRNA2_/MRDRNA2_33276_c0_seq1.p1 gnl/MRDRNA2_/MRDRNA2_33276_c0~~gnl/MRDRNA2_/MRDRNA2_33276_c0_seq1.p1  ORF type:complete len:296 (+),score=77.86 gnl/MRDRNA2_/MRDRNA2_33276_c0_seq1:82-969(+)
MGEPINLKVTVSKGSGFYVRAARNFLEGNKEKEAVDEITISGLGNAINSAAVVASRLEKDGIGTITKVSTAYPDMTAGKSERGVAQLVITMSKGGGGGEVTYDPTPESLTSNKNFEKKNKKVVKEGGKRGVEIEGAADMGGLQFFCTSVDEPGGEVDWLYESLKAMNAKSDPTEEERKGGSGHVGKMIVSMDEGGSKGLALVGYVPPQYAGKIQADKWMKDLLAGLGAPASTYISGNTNTAKAYIANDGDKGLFAMKLKDAAISQSIHYLRKLGLFPEDKDDDDDYVFGDDDFPS